MQVVHEVCCGLDVHKKSVTACVLWATGRRRQTREFGAFTRELLELGDWLRSWGVTHQGEESTGADAERGLGGRRIRRTANGSRTCCNTGCCGPVLCRRRQRENCGI